MHPHPHLPPTTDKNHLLTYVEVSHPFVKHLEALQRRLQEAQMVGKGNVIDLLQTQVHLLHVEKTLVNGGAHVPCRSIEKILDLVNVGRVSICIFSTVLDLQLIGGGLLPQLQFLRI